MGVTVSAGLTWASAAYAWATWPGAEQVPVATGLGLVATLAAAALSGWVSVVLASATLSLCRDQHPDHHLPQTQHQNLGRPGLTARVATGLLAAAAVGLSPTLASAAPPSTALGTIANSASSLVGTGNGGGPATAAPATATPATATPATTAASTMPATTAAIAVASTPTTPGPRVDPPEPGWTPTPASTLARPQPAAEVSLVTTPPAAHEPAEVVVRRGDTLWDIAARHLGADASDQDVAHEWPRWYAVNRDVIGPDPDLIFPGQRLAVPGASR